MVQFNVKLHLFNSAIQCPDMGEYEENYGRSITPFCDRDATESPETYQSEANGGAPCWSATHVPTVRNWLLGMQFCNDGTSVLPRVYDMSQSNDTNEQYQIDKTTLSALARTEVTVCVPRPYNEWDRESQQ